MVAKDEIKSLVGQRCRVSDNLATIRWGPGHVFVPPKKPSSAQECPSAADQDQAQPTVEVLGVEYDDVGFGKHDGTHQGTRLFTCPNGFGSFVKVEKVILGVSIQRALASKYFDGMLPDAASKEKLCEEVDAVDYVDSKGRERTIAVELVGRYGIEQRQQRLEAFVEISFANSGLESRYPEDIWQGDWSFPNIKSLWLDKTLLRNWSDVISICELCPRLQWLSLAKNRLLPLTPGESIPTAAGAPVDIGARLALEPFACQVNTLVLNGTAVSWNTLLALDDAKVFPRLEHLQIASNCLDEGIPCSFSDSGTQPFAGLRTLVLDGNGISDWRVLQRACAAFPRLEALHANCNNLGHDIAGLAAAAADQTPRRLTALFVSENPISSWQAIGALASYAVFELRAQKIPLTEGEKPLASPMLLRQIFIALMPTLMRLNASEVTVKERTAAERYFLSVTAQANSDMDKALRETCQMDEHIERLRTLHGEVVGGVATEEAQASRNTLMNSLVSVTLRPVGSAIVDQPVMVKKLPHTMTVTEIKRLCHSLFRKIPIDRIRLQVAADPLLPFGIALDDEARELGFFGVGDGAEIWVDDASERAKDS